jgi:hypothetical protein
VKRFDNKQFYLDMDRIRDGWGISWQQAARESEVSISTIERIRSGQGFHVESLMLLAEFFELWDLKRYQMKGGGHGSGADRGQAPS